MAVSWFVNRGANYLLTGMILQVSIYTNLPIHYAAPGLRPPVPFGLWPRRSPPSRQDGDLLHGDVSPFHLQNGVEQGYTLCVYKYIYIHWYNDTYIYNIDSTEYNAWYYWEYFWGKLLVESNPSDIIQY